MVRVVGKVVWMVLWRVAFLFAFGYGMVRLLDWLGGYNR